MVVSTMQRVKPIFLKHYYLRMVLLFLFWVFYFVYVLTKAFRKEKNNLSFMPFETKMTQISYYQMVMIHMIRNDFKLYKDFLVN